MLFNCTLYSRIIYFDNVATGPWAAAIDRTSHEADTVDIAPLLRTAVSAPGDGCPFVPSVQYTITPPLH